MRLRFKQLLALALALTLLCTAFAGCGKVDGNSDNGAKRTVTDMAGQTVELPETVEKVFCDWASGITLVMTLGATEKLVAVPAAFETDTFAWAQEICPKIKDIQKDDAPFTNVEVVLNYSPDLIITNNKDNIDTYKNLGLTAIYVNYNSNDSFKESMSIVGTALGTDEKAAADRYNTYFDENVKLVEKRLASISAEDKPSVYYMDSRFGDAYHTVGTGEIQEEWVTIAGGVLATAAEFEGRNLEITAEKLLGLDPDIILIGAQKQAEVYDLLMADKVLAGMSAIKNNSVYRVPQGIFPWCRTGPEAAMQVVWAAKLFYPEQFSDIDIAEMAKSFYKDFYGTDVSLDSINGILAGKMFPEGK